MPDDMLEVLDANIVALLEEPLAQMVNLATFFEGNKLARRMRKPVSVSQAIRSNYWCRYWSLSIRKYKEPKGYQLESGAP